MMRMVALWVASASASISTVCTVVLVKLYRCTTHDSSTHTRFFRSKVDVAAGQESGRADGTGGRNAGIDLDHKSAAGGQVIDADVVGSYTSRGALHSHTYCSFPDMGFCWRYGRDWPLQRLNLSTLDSSYRSTSCQAGFPPLATPGIGYATPVSFSFLIRS